MGELVPPPDGAMPQGWQVALTVLLAVPLVGLGGYLAARYRRERDPVPVLCLAGGALCVLFEPIVDILGLCWYPREGQWTLFETLGRPIPVGVLFGYMWAFGGLTAVAYLVLRDGTPRDLLRLYPIFIAVSIPFELLANHTGFYVYYGDQPLRIWEWPAWWGFVNFTVPIVAARAIVWLRPMFRGPWVLGIALVLPMADGAANGATAWPVWSALNAGDLPAPVVQLAGLATVGLALLLVRIATWEPPSHRPQPGSEPAGALVAR